MNGRRVPAPHRLYPALDAFHAAWRRRRPYSSEHPITRAACYEARAKEMYALADAELTSPLSGRTWSTAADSDMRRAVSILIEADRRAHAS